MQVSIMRFKIGRIPWFSIIKIGVVSIDSEGGGC